jgi:phage terminase large subunit-like protein
MSAPWSFAVKDWRERLEVGKSLVPALPLDRAEYARATAIFNKLRLPDVTGKPALKDAGGEWFREIVGTVLGSIDKETGRRQVPELFLLAPKKSSKTSYGAAFMDTALLLNERPRAEFLMVAPSLAIAHLAFNQAIGMIEADESGFLPKRMHVQQHLRKITDRRTGASLEIKTFDASILTGIRPAGVLLDELHEIAKSAGAQRIIGQIRGGMIAVPESFLAMITTQSDEPPRGAFAAELSNARGIRDGRTGGRTLSVLYEFPERIINDKAIPPAWKDPKNWWMVTPNLGKPFTLDDMEEGLARAERDGTGEVIRWASQHLNIEIGVALGSDRWAGAETWQSAAETDLTLEAILLRCDVVVMGADGGGMDDLLGLAVFGRDAKTGKTLAWFHAWAHQSVLDRRKGEASRLRDFEKAGDLTIVDELGQDTDELEAYFRQVDESGRLFKLGVDPSGVDAVVKAAEAAGIGDDRIVGISQGWKLTGAIKSMERSLASGMFVHCGQPMMRWCVGNAKVEPRGNAIIITKQAAGTAKIDPLMAGFNAQSLMSMNPKPMGSIYDDADAYAKAFTDAPPTEEDDGAWKSAILADPQHPLFAEHRRRFDEWQATQEDD